MFEDLFACGCQDICDSVFGDIFNVCNAHLCFDHSQSSMESPNLEFEYGDTDTLTAELSGKTDQQLNSPDLSLKRLDIIVCDSTTTI